MTVHLFVVIQIYNLFSSFLLFNTYYHSKCRMNPKTIGKVVFGVISVTLAFFTLSLGIFHYMQHSSAERFNNTMIVYKK